MTRILLLLLWPAGIAIIAGAGGVLARRAPRAAAGATATAPGDRTGGAAGAREPAVRLMVMSLGRFCLIAVAGTAAVYAAMAALGTLVVHVGPAIDKPVLAWTVTHRVPAWTAVMNRLTKIGDTWTTWGACSAAAVCMAVTWRRNRWLPPLAFAVAIAIEHYLTLAIRHAFHRMGPPASPAESFPAGGVDDCILFYGLIAYLLWREFSGRRRTAIWAGTAVAAVAFNETYSRLYLTLHRTTDVLSGLAYGSLLLVLIVVAVRLAVGAAGGPAGPPVPAVVPSTTAAAAAPAVGSARE